MPEPNPAGTYYLTRYGPKMADRYVTKSRTTFHDVIHANAIKRGEGAVTCKCHPDTAWPFGDFSEIIKETKRPKKEEPRA